MTYDDTDGKGKQLREARGRHGRDEKHHGGRNAPAGSEIIGLVMA